MDQATGEAAPALPQMRFALLGSPTTTGESVMETVDLKRDELLHHRIVVAGSDAAAICNALSDLITNPPTTGDDQESRMRDIENSLSLLKYNCKRLREYKA
jgi:hypothetical protein